jgi:hypothetical protein
MAQGGLVVNRKQRDNVMGVLCNELFRTAPPGWGIGMVDPGHQRMPDTATGDEVKVRVGKETFWVAWAGFGLHVITVTRQGSPKDRGVIDPKGDMAFVSRWVVAFIAKLVLPPKRTRGRTLAADISAIVDAVTNDVGVAMETALEKHFSKSHIKREFWERAVAATQREAEKEIHKLIGVQATRRSR